MLVQKNKQLLNILKNQSQLIENINNQTLKSISLVNISSQNKISWQSRNPYNKRWQFKWKSAYYTYPREGHEHTQVKRPEDTKDTVPLYWAWGMDVVYRWVPGLQTWWERRHRNYDTFQIYVLPGISLFFYQFTHLNFGFNALTILPLCLAYTRLRDRSIDPDIKETYLREMIYSNPEISELFNEETIQVLDYDLEYDAELPCPEKFPEYQNKTWRFFQTTSGLCTGYFKFGDLESGATMNLKMKTMPASGPFRYQVGEPFYFYDLRAIIKHKGIVKEVVLVDEKECLERMRPFLYII